MIGIGMGMKHQIPVEKMQGLGIRNHPKPTACQNTDTVDLL